MFSVPNTESPAVRAAAQRRRAVACRSSAVVLRFSGRLVDCAHLLREADDLERQAQALLPVRPVGRAA